MTTVLLALPLSTGFGAARAHVPWWLAPALSAAKVALLLAGLVTALPA